MERNSTYMGQEKNDSIISFWKRAFDRKVDKFKGQSWLQNNIQIT